MARRGNIFAPSEDEITAAVVEHWRLLGRLNTLVASIPNKRAFGQPGLTRGLPDLLVIAPGLPVGFIELKKDLRSHYSDDQRMFKRLCDALGIPYALCTGRDEPIATLEQWGAVRKRATRSAEVTRRNREWRASLTPEQRAALAMAKQP